MGEWIERKVSEIISNISDGGTPPRYDPKNFGGDVNWVVVSDIKDEIYETKEKLSWKGFAACSSLLWKPGTIILSTGATIGEVGILQIYSATKQGICGIEVDEALVDNKYLKYWLQQNKQKIKSLAQGSTIKEIRPSTIKKLDVRIPKSVDEQKVIAIVLASIDQFIDKSKRLVAKYERIKTGLIQDLLTHGIDEDGNIRSEETHEFKDSELGRVPIDWKVETIGQSCRIQNSFRKPLSAEVRENMKGRYPYYGPTGILDYINEFRVDGKFVLLGEDGDHFLKFKSQEMTLLVSGKYNVNNHAHILEGKNDCLTEWIHCFFCHRDLTAHLLRQGAGRFKLNKSTLLKLYIALPRTEEQQRIIEKINQLSSFLQKEKDALSKLMNLKKALMQDLLTGKVRVDCLLT